MKSKIYISKEIEKSLGARFKKVLVRRGFIVSYKSLEKNNDIIVLLDNFLLQRIDATCNGLTTDDKNLYKCVKTLKRLLCLSQIDEKIAQKEMKKSLTLLNKSFLYIQRISSDEEENSEYSQLHDLVTKDISVSEIAELFQEYSDFIYAKTNKKISLENLSEKYTSSKSDNQDEDFYVLFKMFPSIGLSDNEKKEFEELLSHSLGLDYEDKMNIIEHLPTLSRFQIDELIKTFIEQEEKFKELAKEHPKNISKLRNTCAEGWIEIKHKTLTDTLPTPEKLFSSLKQYVKGQDHILKPLATILHYQQQIKYSRDSTLEPLSPILLAGPTGSGKSFIVKTSTKVVDLPYVHVDASSLVSEGIRGYGLNDVFKDVLRVSNFNIKRSERAIVFFDEFDKLLLHHDGISIMNQILRVVEGHKVTITKAYGETEEFQDISSLDTNQMLFIFGGSFEHILQDKRQGHTGFLQQDSASKGLNFEDLESSGFPRELLGRIKKIFMLHSLEEKDYLNILKSGEDSPMSSYMHLLESTHGIKVNIDDNVLHAVAKMADKSDYGARRLHQLVHELFEEVLFKAPTSNEEYCIGMESINYLETRIDGQRTYHA